jgi:hypothetical protein
VPSQFNSLKDLSESKLAPDYSVLDLLVLSKELHNILKS